MEFTKYEDYRNIWKDGYTVERDGQKIALTREEIREISNLLDAANGQGSLEYYIDSFDTADLENDEEMKRKVEKADSLVNNFDACLNIWHDYCETISYDTGGEEWEAVDEYIQSVLKKENKDE